jgi:hypothetical protein
MKSMKRTSWLLALLVAGCGTSVDPTGSSAPDDGTGTDVGTPDPTTDPDPCIDLDLCAQPIADVDAGTPPSSGWQAGARVVVLTYAPMHQTASATSALVGGIQPGAGVHDNVLHLWGNPASTISPSQEAKLVTGQKSGSSYEIQYDGHTGWVTAAKLALVDAKMDPVDFALQPNVRNAFFKHQIYRSAWNKDGPSHSGNCAPTSLAMAVRVFGKEPAGLSVEESIHRVRSQYDAGLHESAGTTRAQIQSATTKLGLSYASLSSDQTPTNALSRLDAQLVKKHAVVLEGQPGAPNAGPSLYEQAFNKAYAAAIKAGKSLAHAQYDFNGYHSILVLGQDANGGYVVGDPLSEVGFVTLTAPEMKDYMTRWIGNRGTGTAVYRP